MSSGIMFAIASVAVSSMAHLSLKLGVTGQAQASLLSLLKTGIWSPYLWGGALLHGVALILWLGALAKLPLSQAYPFLAGGFALVYLLSVLFLGESLTITKLLGYLCITIGVIIVAQDTQLIA